MKNIYKVNEEAVKKIAERVYDNGSTVINRNDLEEMFPELKESEDERMVKFIKKQLFNIKKTITENYELDAKLTKAIDWLEKQEQKPNQCENCSIATNNCQKFPCVIRDGKQKTADKVESIEWSGKINSRNAKGVLKEMLDKKLKSDDKVEPKFTNGDWITNGDYTWKIVEVRPLDYIIQSQDGNIVDDTISYVDENFHIWTIKDAKDGDILCSNQIIVLFKQWEDNTNYSFVIAHAGIDVSGKLQVTDGHWLINNKSKPATKEQRDTLFKAMADAGYTFDFERKELKKIEQKPTDEVEPKFKVKYAGSEYNVFETKDIAGVTFYGIEDEPNHIDYVKAENCERVSGYGIKESGLSFPTKPAVFSEQTPAWSEEDEVKDNWELIHEFVEKFGRIPKDEDELNVLVEYVLKRQKPTEWGEEDEKMLNLIIAVFEVNHPNEYFKANELNDPNMRAVYTEEIVTWLKSLRPQSQWKPSDKQMRVIEYICDGNYNVDLDILDSIYRDFKKLRKE